LVTIAYKKYQEAVNIFHKSLIHINDHQEGNDEIWNIYSGLGWALCKTNESKEAVEIFRKSLSLNECWNSYEGLGWALLGTKQYLEAIDAFRKSLARNYNQPKQNIYLSHICLADLYEKVGNVYASIRTQEIRLTYVEPVISNIDPYLGAKATYEYIHNQQIDQLKSTCSANGFELHHSIQANNEPGLESWRYLIYLHIPKCGGTSFARPLHLAKQHLFERQREILNLDGAKRYLSTGNGTSESYVSALTNQLTTGSCKGLGSILLTPHHYTWKHLKQNISAAINACPRIVTTVRDPAERLLSDIKHLSFHCNSMEGLLALVEHKNCGTDTKSSDFNNSMYRHIFDIGLNGDVTCANFDHETVKGKVVDQVDFIDVNDSLTISRVKSAFLSASSLPNIVQPSRLNESVNRESDKMCRLGIDEIQYVFNRCIEKGFLEKDLSIDYDMLKKNTLKRLHIPALENSSATRIHPLTFVMLNEDSFFIISTKQFLQDPLHVINKLNS